MVIIGNGPGKLSWMILFASNYFPLNYGQIVGQAWLINLCIVTSLKEKNPISNLLNSSLKLTLCHIMFVKRDYVSLYEAKLLNLIVPHILCNRILKMSF